MPPLKSSGPAIIIGRQPYREHDLLVNLYSYYYGKLTLLARGAKKFNSKLAAHLEPLSLVDTLIIPGRRFDYLAAVTIRQAFVAIKEDWQKLSSAGQALFLFDKTIKDGEADPVLFNWLKTYLTSLNNALSQAPLSVSISKEKKNLDVKIGDKIISNFDQKEVTGIKKALKTKETFHSVKNEKIKAIDQSGQIFSQEEADGFFLLFLIRFLELSGYRPHLSSCVIASHPLQPGQQIFDLDAGGLICQACSLSRGTEKTLIKISENSVKLLRFLQSNQQAIIIKKSLIKELTSLLLAFWHYHHE